MLIKQAAVIFFLFLVSTVYGQTKSIATPRGKRIVLYEKGGEYFLRWDQAGKLSELSGGFFTMEEGHGHYPSLVTENDRYIVLRAGCGSPCWVGDFLPLYAGGKAFAIGNYLAFDLRNEIVASESQHVNSILLTNLKTGRERNYYVGKCASAFIDYCIDTAFFEGNKLVYSWNPNVDLGHKKREWHQITIWK